MFDTSIVSPIIQCVAMSSFDAVSEKLSKVMKMKADI